MIKCDICGKFISNKDLGNHKVEIVFIPDSEFTVEETIYKHLSCI